jgi:hypothetical protein
MSTAQNPPDDDLPAEIDFSGGTGGTGGTLSGTD